MHFEDGEAPRPDKRTKYNKYNASDKGKSRKRNYRGNRSVIDYLSKEFVAWDGEGGNESDGSHTYFLLANSDGYSWTARDGLSTVEVFKAFLSGRSGVINIIYGGGYDTNMFLRDLDIQSLETLYKTGEVRWNGYRLQWRAGKSFSVRRGKRSFLLYDVLPFFQRSFVSACDEYLGRNWECRDEIIREKARRGTFDWAELDAISRYNRAELSNLVSLATELRERLYKVDIRITRWDGPGAIATALYKKYETKSFIGPPINEASEASRHAYCGGRFEIIRKGHSMGAAYQYDVRSAYPSAIRYLPCLAHGRWRNRKSPDTILDFGMYRIEVTEPLSDSITQPQPLWMRNKNGTVYFSEFSHGWYWTPEARLAQKVAESQGEIIIHEAWEWIPECDHQPFKFVEGLYNKRAALKRAGDGAHVGLKLGLNSLYGKLAQQIGWQEGPPMVLPPYHSLEWAGWITSHCRAQVYDAAALVIDDVIAFETDAVFTRAPLPVPLGDRLGQWEETKYANLTYLKSGMYYGTLDSGKDIEKSRGINKGTITRDDVVKALQAEDLGLQMILPSEQTRFIGLGLAMNTKMTNWRRWITAPRMIQVGLNGKRIDLLSGEDSRKDMGDGWKETQEGMHDTEFSFPYAIAWINPQDIISPNGDNILDVRIADAHYVMEGVDY